MSERATSYCTKGYAIAPRLIGPRTVAQAASLIPAGRSGLLPVPAGSSSVVDAVAADARLVGFAAALLDGPVECFGMTFIVKAPGPAGAGQAALWHQDGWPWERDRGITSAVTLWVALDRMSAHNGGLAVIPGSHTLEAQPLGPAGRAPDGEPGGCAESAGAAELGLFGGGINPALVDSSRAVFVEMEAGDVSAHHPRLIHGSPVNRSDRDRRALVLRYRPA